MISGIIFAKDGEHLHRWWRYMEAKQFEAYWAFKYDNADFIHVRAGVVSREAYNLIIPSDISISREAPLSAVWAI